MLNHGIDIQIPEQVKAEKIEHELDVQKVEKWLQTLDPNDISLLDKFIATLTRINHLQRSFQVRLEILKIVRPFFNTFYQQAKDVSAKMYFPLSSKQEKNILQIQQLLLEMAIAYKIVVHDLLMMAKLSSAELLLLRHAIYNIMDLFSLLLVERYQIYLSSFSGLWKDINQLYFLAEKLGIATQRDNENEALSTIEHVYKRMVVITIADPYHMEFYEADKVYQFLDDIVAYCRLEQVKPDELDNFYGVDLLQDKQPGLLFVADLSKVTYKRKLNVKPILVMTSKFIDKLNKKLLTLRTEQIEKRMLLRSQKDMLERLSHILQYTGKRIGQRVAKKKSLNVAVGLSACHYFLSGKTAFIPEELEQQQREKEAEGLRIGQNYRKNDEEFLYLSQAMHSQYDDVEEVTIDAVQTILVENSIFTSETWQQRDECEGGLSMISKGNTYNQIRVGGLIAYKYENQHTGYALGIVRWLRMAANKCVVAGVAKLADAAKAVATKAVKTGKGSEYARSVLVLSGDREAKEATLIVPAGLYQIGSLIRLNYNGHIRIVKIEKILICSSHFVQAVFSLRNAA